MSIEMPNFCLMCDAEQVLRKTVPKKIGSPLRCNPEKTMWLVEGQEIQRDGKIMKKSTAIFLRHLGGCFWYFSIQSGIIPLCSFTFIPSRFEEKRLPLGKFNSTTNAKKSLQLLLQGAFN